MIEECLCVDTRAKRQKERENKQIALSSVRIASLFLQVKGNIIVPPKAELNCG